MADITLKKKITLRRKGESVEFTFDDKLKVQLFWTSDTDQDLCIFFKKKDGGIGGVFSNEYRGKKSDLGSLDKFPFMLHRGDEKDPTEGNEQMEQVDVKNLDEIDTAYVCVVNYGAAIEGEDVTFANEGCRVELKSNTGDYLEVIGDSDKNGYVFCVCSIKNENGKNSVTKVDEVYDLSEAYDRIPGFSLITND